MLHWRSIAIALVLCCANGCDQKQQHKRSSAEFDTIRSLATAGKYAEAKPKLEAFLKDHPRHAHASRAGLFLGKVNMGTGDLAAAKEAFEMTIEKYPGTLEDHKSRYKLAVIALLEGNDAEAVRKFDALADKPDGPLAAESAAIRTYLKARGRNLQPEKAPPDREK